jgi:vacuolar protein 8
MDCQSIVPSTVSLAVSVSNSVKTLQRDTKGADLSDRVCTLLPHLSHVAPKCVHEFVDIDPTKVVIDLVELIRSAEIYMVHTEQLKGKAHVLHKLPVYRGEKVERKEVESTFLRLKQVLACITEAVGIFETTGSWRTTCHLRDFLTLKCSRYGQQCIGQGRHPPHRASVTGKVDLSTTSSSRSEPDIPQLLQQLRSENVAEQAEALRTTLSKTGSSTGRRLLWGGGIVPVLVEQLNTNGTTEVVELAAAAVTRMTTDTEIRLAVRETVTLPLILLLSGGKGRAKEHAAAALRNLATEAGFRQHIAENGAIPLLVRVLIEGTAIAQEKAAGALVTLGTSGGPASDKMLQNLTLDARSSRVLATAGALCPLVQMLTEGTEIAQERAAATLANFAAEPLNRKLVHAAGAVPVLIVLLRKGGMGVKMQCARALWRLCADDAVRGIIAAAGAISPLVQLVREGDESAQEQATGALHSLGAERDHRDTMAVAGAAISLVQVLKVGTEGAKEQAAGTLSLLAIDPEALRAIAGVGAVPPLVELLASEGALIRQYSTVALARLAADLDNRASIAAEAVPSLVLLLSEDSQTTVLHAMEALYHLSSTASCRVAIGAAGAMSTLAQALITGTSQLQRMTASAVRRLAEEHDNRQLFASAGGVEALVQMLSAAEAEDLSKECASGALSALTVDADVANLAAEAGAVVPVVQLLRTGSDDAKEYATTALGNLAAEARSRKQMVSAGAVALLVGLVGSDRDSLKEAAVLTLWAVAVAPENRRFVVAAGAIPVLAQVHNDGTAVAKERAAAVLRVVFGDAAYTSAEVAGIAVPPLVQLLSKGTEVSQEHAAGALWLLALNEDCRRLIVAEGVVPNLVQLLRDGTDGARELAAGALLVLTGSDYLPSPERSKQVGSPSALQTDADTAVDYARVVPPLVKLLREGTAKAREHAAGILWHLVSEPSNRRVVIKHKAIPPLVHLLEHGTPEAQQHAAAVLWNLATDAETCKAIAAAGALPLLVGVLSSDVECAKEYAAGALWNLAAVLDCKLMAIEAGAVPVLVQVLHRQESTERVKEVAAGALRVITAGSVKKQVHGAAAEGVPQLVQMLRDGCDAAKESAAVVLCNLSEQAEHCEAMAQVDGVASHLVALVSSSSTALTQEAAAQVLARVAALGEGCRAAIVEAGAIPPLVQLLRDGSEGAKAQAAGALEVLWSSSS